MKKKLKVILKDIADIFFLTIGIIALFILAFILWDSLAYVL